MLSIKIRMDVCERDIVISVVDKLKIKLRQLEVDIPMCGKDEQRLNIEFKSFIVDIMETLKTIDENQDDDNHGDDEDEEQTEDKDSDVDDDEVQESDVDDNDYE
jgi:N12 class adenine-specific DNA methylase